MKCRQWSLNGFHIIIFERFDQERVKSIPNPFIFADYGRRLDIGMTAFP